MCVCLFVCLLVLLRFTFRIHLFKMVISGKKEACFALGGYFKGKNDNDPLINLLQCEIDCCTGKDCNTQVPTLSPNAIAVFTPSGKIDAHLILSTFQPYVTRPVLQFV